MNTSPPPPWGLDQPPEWSLPSGGSSAGSWPAIATQRRPWEWHPDGPKPPPGDRHFHEFDAAVPAAIAEREVRPGPEAARALAAADEAVRVLDSSATVDLTALAGALLRSESVASSRIEHLRASQRDVGIAMVRGTSRGMAAEVAANVHAMTTAIRLGDRPGACTLADLLEIQRILLRNDPEHSDWAGHLRTVQNWIGGSFHSPRDALFVPPPPGLVRPAVEDLVRFCNRTDLDPLAQAAIAHAQFETVHPFTDGNGRTGRALVHVVLRRRGLTRHSVLPVSTVLLADVDAYFAGLSDYRSGRLDLWLARFAAAAAHAAAAGLRLAGELAEVRQSWLATARPRRGSAGAAILQALLRQPVVDIATLREISGSSRDPVADKNLYRAVDRLVSAGILTEVSGGGRNRVWAALDVLDLLERFEARLGRRRPSG